MRMNEGTSDELRHGSSNTILVFAELWNDNAHHHAAIIFIYILKWKIHTSFMGWNEYIVSECVYVYILQASARGVYTSILSILM